MEVREGGVSSVAVRHGFSALTVLEVGTLAVAVVPRGEDKRHASIDEFRQVTAEVVLARFLHHDFVLTLGDSGPHSPESRVVLSGEELSLDMENTVGVDQRATRAVSAFTVLGGTLSAHVVHALGDGVAGAVTARVCSNIETKVVSLHDVDGGAVDVVVSLRVLGAPLVVVGNEVETGDATAVVQRHVDVVLNHTASEVGFERVVGSIVWLRLQEHVVVVVDPEIGSSGRGVREVLRADVGSDRITIVLDFPRLVLGSSSGGYNCESCELFHSFACSLSY